MEFLLNIVLGLMIGTVGGIFGIGGGLIAIPVLGIFYGQDQQLAQGTALVMVVPNVLLSIWRYNQHNRIDKTNLLLLCVPSFLFAILGSQIAVSLDAQQMRQAFVIFLLALAVYTGVRVFIGPRSGSATLGKPRNRLLGLGAVAGIGGGLFGVGGAVIAVPLLTLWLGLSQVVAQGLAIGLAAPSTMVTLVSYALHDQVNWSIGAGLAIGGLASISWGVRIAHALPDRIMRGLYSLFLFACALALAFK